MQTFFSSPLTTCTDLTSTSVPFSDLLIHIFRKSLYHPQHLRPPHSNGPGVAVGRDRTRGARHGRDSPARAHPCILRGALFAGLPRTFATLCSLRQVTILISERFPRLQSEDDSAVCFASTASHPLSVEPVLEVFANHRPSAAQIGHHVVSMEVRTIAVPSVRAFADLVQLIL